jgi:hypothetical protein
MKPNEREIKVLSVDGDSGLTRVELPAVRVQGFDRLFARLSDVFTAPVDDLTLPFCACGRLWSECDGSRAGCRKAVR